MARVLTEELLTPEAVIESGRRMLGDYVRRAADGDHNAFMVFYDATCDDAYCLARFFLADEKQAAEIVVHTYVTAFRDAREFEASGRSARAWLLTILQREVISR